LKTKSLLQYKGVALMSSKGQKEEKSDLVYCPVRKWWFSWQSTVTTPCWRWFTWKTNAKKCSVG